MKKKIIFTSITIGLVALLGFGFLGSINSEPKETKANEITKPHKKYAKVNQLQDILGQEGIFYATAKNAENNGNNTFYVNGNLSSGVLMDYTIDYNGEQYLALDIDVTLINSDMSTYDTFLRINTSLQHQGVYQLTNVFFSNVGYIYNSATPVFNRDLCAFLFENAKYRYPGEGDRNSQLGAWFLQLFDIYKLENEYFEFVDFINYNATYGQDLDSFVVNDSYFSDNSKLFKEVTLFSGVPFYSGGLVFDTITLSFDNAYGTKLSSNGSNIQAWSSFNFGYFHEMRYKNSATNLIVAVNTRIFGAYYNSNESGLYLTSNSKWVSKNYQKITFFNNVTDIDLTNLSKLNNTSFTGGFYTDADSNLGLGNAFALISQAFSAWLPILQVSIVPGITLGLLLFLPLIAGIIIFIIWIVKR